MEQRQMPWFAGVCYLVPTTRRVCGLVRLAVALVLFLIAAAAALTGALTFGSARSSTPTAEAMASPPLPVQAAEP